MPIVSPSDVSVRRVRTRSGEALYRIETPCGLFRVDAVTFEMAATHHARALYGGSGLGALTSYQRTKVNRHVGAALAAMEETIKWDQGVSW